MTGESSSHTGRVWQREVTNKPPTDHASDQDNDEDNSSEVNRKDDQVEFIREFQDFMNEAIERLLNKPARKHSCQKDKPELCMEQGKRKEVLRQEVETLPPINISGDSDNEQNSRISLETLNTDRCILKLVRTNQEGSERAQCKIEETIQYWVAQERKAVMNYCRALELNNTVSNKRVQQLYSEDQPQEVIDQAERQAGSARRTLESIRRVDEARLSRNSPKHPRTPRAAGRHKYYAKDDM